MPRGKKFTAEQITGKLREAEVELARGKTVPEVVRKLGVTEQTYYRWKREYGGPTNGSGQAAEGSGEGERQTEAAPGGRRTRQSDSS